MPEAVTELEDLEIENKQFADSFVNLKVPSVPPDPTTNASDWDGLDKVREQPWQQQHEAKNGKMAGAAELPERVEPGGYEQQRPPPN